MIAREDLIREFLNRAGWSNAARAPLAGDASSRRYERLKGPRGKAILMDAPPGPDGPPLDTPQGARKAYSAIAHLAEDCRSFVAVGEALRRAHLSAPELYAHDIPNGLLLLEDLGDDLYGIAIDNSAGPRGESLDDMYHVGVEALIAWHKAWEQMHAPATLPLPDGDIYKLFHFDDAALAIETELLTDWYLPERRGAPTDEAMRNEYRALWKPLFAIANKDARTLALRDYHSPNMLWLPEREAAARVGLLDYQDAIITSRAYDLVSFLQDARRDVPESREQVMLAHYCALASRQLKNFNEDIFRAAYAVLGAQRNAKIMGIFVRLNKRDGKPAYLAHLPRVSSYFARDLAHPALADLRNWLGKLGFSPAKGDKE
jgi:aminoglycoside/choline kinase family phosphotransferase